MLRLYAPGFGGVLGSRAAACQEVAVAQQQHCGMNLCECITGALPARDDTFVLLLGRRHHRR